MKSVWFHTIWLLAVDGILAIALWQALPSPARILNSPSFYRANFKQPDKPIQIERSKVNYSHYRQIPDTLKFAILYLEDGNFYRHRGFDSFEIKRALHEHLRQGKRLRGASTISQQVAKNLYLSPERSFQRKLLEALITIKIENSLSKEQIMELYVNIIDWGENIIGLKSASQFYFDRHPHELTAKQSAFLAAIIPNPARLSKKPDDLYIRSQMLRTLEHLYQVGVISIDDYRTALIEGL